MKTRQPLSCNGFPELFFPGTRRMRLRACLSYRPVSEPPETRERTLEFILIESPAKSEERKPTGPKIDDQCFQFIPVDKRSRAFEKTGENYHRDVESNT